MPHRTLVLANSEISPPRQRVWQSYWLKYTGQKSSCVRRARCPFVGFAGRKRHRSGLKRRCAAWATPNLFGKTREFAKSRSR